MSFGERLELWGGGRGEFLTGVFVGVFAGTLFIAVCANLIVWLS
jgi:hypothetical protein